ncbi:hypothetical protein TRFO_30174 [Tritrichomonas foetus]|uniref:Uncharacterized protein n=1 Tax=Tritrichomonas foetus TaxID=1144522 RepID=A0A1J4JYR5_9EUKA|nr:hypothetical protein TRFO_30174 [Tritrichomonas foetus]|eukprot:OHT02676.1 hypothetical protein TRFO_30174 [Tritrichomonas foetus]
MHQIKGLFNQTRTFPQYHDTIDALNLSIESQRKVIEGISLVFSDDYTIFCKNQNKETKSSILGIQQAGKKQIKIMQNLLNSLSVLPTDLSILLTLYNNIVKEWSVVVQARENAQKSKANLEKLEMSLERSQNKESPEYKKLLDLKDAAKKQEENDYKLAEKLRDEKFVRVNELKKMFMDSLAKSLKAAAEAREETAKELNHVASEMSNAVLEFQDYNSSDLDKLKERMKQLEEEDFD